MAQHGFNHFGGGHSNGSIDPNDLSMSNGFSASYNNNSNGNLNNNGGHNNMSNNNSNNAFSSGNAVFGDDELLDGLASPIDGGMHQGQDYPGMHTGGFSQNSYATHRGSQGLQIDPSQMNGFSHTPDGDPVQSPFTASFNAQFQRLQTGSLGTSLHSPLSYSGSPLAGGELNMDGNDPNYLNAKARARMSQQMQRKGSSNRSPMTPKSNLQSMSLGSQDSPGFTAQPMTRPGHDKSPSGQWLGTPGSIPASYNSGFSSPMQPGMAHMNEVMMKGGTSMPTKLGSQTGGVSSQEMKRKRRRESHNLVERRRRDNINERIQDLSKLVPSHRLEDEKIRKLIQNGTPLSPTLTGMASPTQATSGLAGPGNRRATGATTGSITTGLPIEDKDKGPNKGDILNGAVSWTRDLMWMLQLKLQQQEELMNQLTELGGHFPFEFTEDERRMQSELMEAMSKLDNDTLSYTRTAGSGLRVPDHTDYKGDPVNGFGGSNLDTMGLTPEPNGALDLNDNAFWRDAEDHSGRASLDFKEEDEYDMELN